MKPWQNAHTVAVLWMLVGVIAVGWIAGLVAEYQARLDLPSVSVPVKPVPASVCGGAHAGAWCP